MDAPVSRPRRYRSRHSFFLPQVSRGQVREERKALAAALAKPDDRLLADAGLDRETASALLWQGRWCPRLLRACADLRPGRQRAAANGRFDIR